MPKVPFDLWQDRVIIQYAKNGSPGMKETAEYVKRTEAEITARIYTLKELATILGVELDQLENVAQVDGRIRLKQTRMTPREVTQLVKMAKTGEYTAMHLASYFKRRKAYIVNTLEKEGVDPAVLKDQPKPNKKKEKVVPERKEIKFERKEQDVPEERTHKEIMVDLLNEIRLLRTCTEDLIKQVKEAQTTRKEQLELFQKLAKVNEKKV